MKLHSLLQTAAVAALFSVLWAIPAQAVTTNITAIYGSGNPDADWDSFVSGNTQIGLRAKETATGATPDNGAGLYTFATGTVWNFEASFNSDVTGGAAGTHLISFVYSWTLSGPGIAGGSQTFSPTLYADNSYGIASTANGAGVEGTFAALGGANTIMQLSQKITFFPFLGSFSNEGLYTLSASMTNLQGTPVNAGSIQIQVGSANVPDAGSSAFLLGISLAVLGALRHSNRRSSLAAR
jgi:hypothetical protein